MERRDPFIRERGGLSDADEWTGILEPSASSMKPFIRMSSQFPETELLGSEAGSPVVPEISGAYFAASAARLAARLGSLDALKLSTEFRRTASQSSRSATNRLRKREPLRNHLRLTAAMTFPQRSACAETPGGMTMVEADSAMSAGPVSTAPGVMPPRS